ncbi:MAG: hypothetical protein JWN06_4259, partial [Propionibacteriaceae bacterium]|nr:hypothetical protein [Propionibacteriaceae bacterium]
MWNGGTGCNVSSRRRRGVEVAGWHFAVLSPTRSKGKEAAAIGP